MSDEQTMYIEPEDDVTTVRERLRQTPGKQLTLVIPPQSQLRSHLTWRLLNARARELGKDILIVSADPQIRSLAHAVKFRVAHSLESSSQAGKSRPPSRPGRSVTGKSRVPGRPTSARDVQDTRGSRAIQSLSGTSERGASQFRPAPTPLPEQSWPLGPVPSSPPLQTPQIEDLGPDDAIAGGPPLFGPTERANKPFDQSYDFRAPTAPPIYPVHNEAIEEPDPLFEDYQQAQVIRRAASEGHSQKGPGQSAPEGRRLVEQISQPAEPVSVPEPTTSHPHITDDPFVHMEDSQPPPPAEQRAGVVIEDFDINEPQIDEEQKIEEALTTIIDGAIEFRGDQDDFVPPLSPKPITTYAEPATDDKTEGKIPPRARGGRQSKRRGGNITPPSTRQEFDDDALPMPDEPPTAIIPPSPPRRSIPLPPQTPAARTSGNLAEQRLSGRPSRELAESRDRKSVV